MSAGERLAGANKNVVRRLVEDVLNGGRLDVMTSSTRLGYGR